MTPVLLFQAFNGDEVKPMPYRPVVQLLSAHGKLGRGRGDLEMISDLAHCCIVVGDEAGGVQCIGLERAQLGEPLSRFAFALMRTFGCCLFDDALQVTYWVEGAPLPAALSRVSLSGARRIATPQQLWPDNMLSGKSLGQTPGLRYPNPHAGAPNHVYVDEIDGKTAYVNLRTRPEACNAGTMRVLRNILMRIEDAQGLNPDFSVQIRCASSAWSMIMATPPVAESRGDLAFVAPLPWEDAEPGFEFELDFERDLKARASAVAFVEHAPREFRSKLDYRPESLPVLEKLVERLHQTFRQALEGKPASNEVFDKLVALPALGVGAYYGCLVRAALGAQWGYADFMGRQVLERKAMALKLHTGTCFLPRLLALDWIVNGRPGEISAHFARLAAAGKTLAGDTDFASAIPETCQRLLNEQRRELPLYQEIPVSRLDFSLESLDALDEYLRSVGHRLASQQKMSHVPEMIAAAGCYAGEVIRRRAGKQWRWVNFNDHFRDREPVGGLEFDLHTAVLLVGPETVALPLAQVCATLQQKPDESTRAFAERTLKEFAARKAQAGRSIFGSNAAIAAVQAADMPPNAGAQPATSRPVSASPTVAANPPAKSAPDVAQRVRDWPLDREKRALLAELGSTIARRRRSATEASLAALQAPAGPAWMRDWAIISDQPLLLRQGVVGWGAMVRGAKDIYKPGSEDACGVMVYSQSDHFDGRPGALVHIARAVNDLKGTQPPDPDLKSVAEWVANEARMPQNLPLPLSLTAFACKWSAHAYFRQHLPQGVARGIWFPVLSHDSARMPMIVPCQWWTEELLTAWRKGEMAS